MSSLSEWWKSWWPDFWGGIAQPVTQIHVGVKSELMLQQGINPCFSFTINHGAEREAIFVLAVSDNQITGLTTDILAGFSCGVRVLDRFSLTEVKWLNPETDLGGNGVAVEGFREAIEDIARRLPYDKRMKICTTSAGVDLYLNGGFNHNREGFTADVPCDKSWCVRGYVAGFVHYKAVPFYHCKWHIDAVTEDVPDFVYYDWMGDQLSPPRLLEKQKKDQKNLTRRLEMNIAQRRALDTDLADIIKRLNKAHVHE